MTRFLLILVLIAVVLLGTSRLTSAGKPEPTPTPTEPVRPPRAPNPAPRVVTIEPAGAASPEERTPFISQMARMEARRQLDRVARLTYLDSLFVTPDSTVRRWADRTTIRVVILPPDSAPQIVAEVRAALRAWSEFRLGLDLVESSDSTGAEIVVGWVDAFEATPDGGSARTGLTELRSDYLGQIRSARVQLARTDGRGGVIGATELRAVAAHELGHALGLPHSGRETDIMYPTVLVPRLSERDRASAELLYSLPSGPLREPPTR